MSNPMGREPIWKDQRVCEVCGCAKCICRPMSNPVERIHICPTCDGSGEGRTPRSRCADCWGSGEVKEVHDGDDETSVCAAVGGAGRRTAR